MLGTSKFDPATRAEALRQQERAAYDRAVASIAERWNIDVELAHSLIKLGHDAMDRFEDKGSSRIERIRHAGLIVEEITLPGPYSAIKLWRVGVKRPAPTAADPLSQGFAWSYICKTPEEAQAFLRGLMIGEMGGRV